MNYKEIYLWGRSELEKAGIMEFELDARLLLEFICHTNRNTLLVHGDREVVEEEEKCKKIYEITAYCLPKKHVRSIIIPL